MLVFTQYLLSPFFLKLSVWDASGSGFSADLIQDKHPIAYISIRKSLSSKH